MTGQPSAEQDMLQVESVQAAAYTFPTDEPEADGTLAWDRTTLVVTATGGGQPADGRLRLPDADGLGLSWRTSDVEGFRVR